MEFTQQHVIALLPLLTVSATGRAETVPDEARFTLGVVTQAASAREASRLNAEKMAKVTAALKVFGVEPEQCDLLNDHHAPHDIQGLSIGIVPEILNLSVLDGMLKVSKSECLDRVRRTMANDGISLGISSAANLAAISKLSRDLPPDAVVLTMVYDGVESYLADFG